MNLLCTTSLLVRALLAIVLLDGQERLTTCIDHNQSIKSNMLVLVNVLFRPLAPLRFRTKERTARVVERNFGKQRGGKKCEGESSILRYSFFTTLLSQH